jgi:hypothetical protein
MILSPCVEMNPVQKVAKFHKLLSSGTKKAFEFQALFVV